MSVQKLKQRNLKSKDNVTLWNKMILGMQFYIPIPSHFCLQLQFLIHFFSRALLRHCRYIRAANIQEIQSLTSVNSPYRAKSTYMLFHHIGL